jgi:hypothetical protein
VTGSPEAEFGRSSGATVNIVTKSGSNTIHGSASESFRNGSLNARNYFNTVDLPKNSFTNHQFSGLIDGPIFKDESFFTLADEGQRENGGLPQLGTVPGQADIANYIANFGPVHPVIQKLLDSKPWGTLPATGGNATFTTPFSNDSDNVIAKVDQHLHLFSPGDLLTARYFYAHGTQSFPLGMLYTGSSAPGFNTSTPTHVNIVSLSYTSIPRPNLIIEVRGGYNRFLQQFLPQDIGLNPVTAFGLNSLPPGFSPRDLGLPTIVVSGLSPIGSTASDSRGRVDTNYQLFGNVSLVKGRHSYKAGYEWRRTFINSFIDSGHRGKLVFDSLDDFLSGTIDTESGSGTGSAEGSGTRYSYQNGSGAYLLDSWHLNGKITLNYGLRWDYFGVVGAKDNAFSLFNVKTGSMETVGATGAPASLYPKDWTNFAPRLSLADDLLGTGKLVIRTGVGVFYDGASQDFFVGNQPWNTNPAEAGPAFNGIGFATSIASTIPTDGSAIFSNYEPNSVFTVDQSLVTPRYVSYNLNIESQLAKAVALQIGYVGSQGRHLYHFRDLNQVNNEYGPVTCASGQTIQPGNVCYQSYSVGSFTNIPLLYVNQIETSALSNYNSLQTTLKLLNWHNLTSTVNYTWAHSIDTASDGLDFVPNAAQPDDSFNPHAERASSNFDVRQRFQWYWTYNLPKSGHAEKLLDGWALDGMFNFATGQPYTVSYIYEGDFNGSGEWFGRVNIVGNPHIGTGGTKLLNLAAFALPNGHPGNEGRNAFNAPDYTNFDLSLTKTSHLTEKLTMELRTDFFNVLNHPNFSNPLLPGFGVDLLGSSSQFLQATATPDVGSGNPYLGGGGPRSLQLAVHFAF